MKVNFPGTLCNDISALTSEAPSTTLFGQWRIRIPSECEDHSSLLKKKKKITCQLCTK